MAPQQLSLELGSSRALRRRITSAFLFGGLLAIGDLAAFALVRELLRYLATGPVEDSWFGSLLSVSLDGGAMSGWSFGVALVLGLLIARTYGIGDRRRDVGKVLLGVATATTLALWTTAWLDPSLAVGQFVLIVLFLTPALAIARGATESFVEFVARAADQTERVVLVGNPAGEAASRLHRTLRSARGMSVLGWVHDAGADRLGSTDDVADVLAVTRPDTVVLCGPLSPSLFDRVANAADEAGCRLLSFMSLGGGLHPALVWRRGVPFVELVVSAGRARQLLVKRGLDLVVATLGLVFLSPLLLLTAALVRLDSPGSPLFSQERVGQGGRTFVLWKFRTMRAGASDDLHRQYVGDLLAGVESPSSQTEDGQKVFKLTGDPRVTRIGHWLRKTSIDELPQLWNVIKGDMSLVGPRPPLPYECEKYEEWQFERLRVKPGITGLWQVSGRSLLTYRQMCELDVQYVRRWSLSLDLVILLRTAPVVLFNVGRAG